MDALDFTTADRPNATDGHAERAVFAARPVAAGELLLTEQPFASMQLPDNAAHVRTCGSCLRACGTISRQLQHAARLASLPTLPLAEAEDDLICAEVGCRSGCSAVFCSKSCEAEAADGFHAYLCGGSKTNGKPDGKPGSKPGGKPGGKRSGIGGVKRSAAWAAFEEHAFSEGENFLFAARLVARVLARANALHRREGHKGAASACAECTAEARRPLAPFCRGAWWEIAAPPEGLAEAGFLPEAMRAMELLRYRQELREAAAESHRLLLALLRCDAAPPELGWLDLGEWGGILGLARQNSICCDLGSPVIEVVDMLRAYTAAAGGGGSKEGEEGEEESEEEGEEEGEDESEEGEEEDEEESEESEEGEENEEGEEGEEEGGAGIDPSEAKALSTLLARLPRRMPGVIGTGLFERLACINHSCEPNAEVWLLASVTAVTTQW